LISGSLARRYAQALLDVAAEPAVAEEVGAELTAVAAMLREQRELRQTLANPAVRTRDALELLEAVLDRMEIRPLSRTFLRVVLEGGRLAGLGEILRAYQGLLDERLGRVRAAVTAAAPLEAGAAARLTDELRRLTGKEVLLEVAENPAILGGVITRIGSRVYDGSLRTRLATLREQLVRGE
jgi:F-type H+-transporting ATPase subunit delta